MTALNPVMRVGEQIAEVPLVRLGAVAPRARSERALELMRLVGIPDPARRAEAYPHELSGGMRQRVMIAIALSGEPEADPLRRADDGARRDDPGSDPEAAAARCSDELGVSARVRLARPRGDRADLPAGRRDVRGPDRRDGRGRRTSSASRGIRTRSACCARCPTSTSCARRLSSIPGAPPDLASPPPGCRFHPRCQFVQTDCLERRDPAASSSAADARRGACTTISVRGSTCGASR